jgi:hypothetical protein
MTPTSTPSQQAIGVQALLAADHSDAGPAKIICPNSLSTTPVRNRALIAARRGSRNSPRDVARFAPEIKKAARAKY